MPRLKTLLIPLVVLLLAACDTFRPPDTSATLSAQNTAFAQEATWIYQTLQAQSATTVAFAIRAETEVVVRNAINQQLLATVVVGDPPTQQVVQINPVGTYYRPFDGNIAVTPLPLPDASALASGATPAPDSPFVD